MKVLLIGFGFVGKATYLLKNKDVDRKKIMEAVGVIANKINKTKSK